MSKILTFLPFCKDKCQSSPGRINCFSTAGKLLHRPRSLPVRGLKQDPVLFSGSCCHQNCKSSILFFGHTYIIIIIHRKSIFCSFLRNLGNRVHRKLYLSKSLSPVSGHIQTGRRLGGSRKTGKPEVFIKEYKSFCDADLPSKRIFIGHFPGSSAVFVFSIW